MGIALFSAGKALQLEAAFKSNYNEGLRRVGAVCACDLFLCYGGG